MGYNSAAPIVFETVSAVTATPSETLGTRRIEDGNEYLYCYNGGAAQISHGEMGYLSPTSMLSGYTVTVSNAASQSGSERLVGVAGNATITTGAYGWLCTRGFTDIALDGDEVSMASNVDLACGVDGGFVAATATLSTGLRIGITLNSIVTTVGTGRAYFKSPFFG